MTHEPHRMRTLWLCTALHAFTHLYQVALIPLYLLIRRDFQLQSDGEATFLVTAMGVAYFLPGYPMGVLADRVSRKKLLGWGLAINALGFIGLSFAPNYPAAIACILLAGFGGSCFHPAATSLVARLFPEAPGKALGRVGLGASFGFFLAPSYAGWRAETAGWRQPVLELGVLGVAGAIAFAFLAHEHSPHKETFSRSGPPEKMFATPALWFFFILGAALFSLRDFAGSGMVSLSSLFLQRAHHFTSKETGLALSCIFLASGISNPLFGHLSDRGRIRWAIFVLLSASLVIFLFPRAPAETTTLFFAAYGFFFMASYPMVEAGLMESVHDSVRGRVFGFFITIGGFLGNLAHWFVGNRVKNLGNGATIPGNYLSTYNLLALFVVLSLGGLACLHAIRRRENEIAPLTAPASAVPRLNPEV